MILIIILVILFIIKVMDHLFIYHIKINKNFENYLFMSLIMFFLLHFHFQEIKH